MSLDHRPKMKSTKMQFIDSDVQHLRNNDDDDDGNDVLCALCDDGGNLLSCVGQCKRSFHPRHKDGSESKCETLGYTSAQIKEISTYLCKNCEHKQHQCFKCGALEPSAETNARVFQCNDPSCGHFYHPGCVGKLLEPDDTDGDTSCELAKRIMEGMPFTCPVHWCFKCGKLEDKTQRALQFAVCRRCPKSYHIECLPREISFEMSSKHVEQRAWEFSKVIMIYCLEHKICKATGNARRDHIKFPHLPKISKVGDHAERKSKIIGKRKRNLDKCSTKQECSVMHLKEDLQSDIPMVGAARISNQKAMKGQKKQLRILLPFFMRTGRQYSAVGSKSKKRKTSRPKKKASSGTFRIIAKCAVPFVGMLERSVQGTLLEKLPVDKDAELDKDSCRIEEYKDGNRKEKSSEHYSGNDDVTNKETFHENKEQNDVPSKIFADEHTRGVRSKLRSRQERSMEWGENADGHDSISRQERDTSKKENQMSRRMREQDLRLNNSKIATNKSTKSALGNNEMNPDHVDESSPEKQHAPHVNNMTITDITNAQQEYSCDEDGQVSGGYYCQVEPNSSQCNGSPKSLAIDTLGDKSIKRRNPKETGTDGNSEELDKNKKCNSIKEKGREAHYGHDDSSHQCPPHNKERDYLDRMLINSGLNSSECNDENKAAEIYEYKSGQSTRSSRTEHSHNTIANSPDLPIDESFQMKATSHSPKWQRAYHDHDRYKQHPVANNQHTSDQWHNVSLPSNGKYEYDTKNCGSLQPVVSAADFNASRWQDSGSYPRGPEFMTGWYSPSLHPINPGNFAGTWHSPPLYPGRPEHVDYSMNGNNILNPGYGVYGNFNQGGYHAMSIHPATRYPFQFNTNGAYGPHTCSSVGGSTAVYGGYYSECGVRSNYAFGGGPRAPTTCSSVGGSTAVYGGHYSERGVRSNYAFGWRPRAPTALPVTDRYAPHLEQTNKQPRS